MKKSVISLVFLGLLGGCSSVEELEKAPVPNYEPSIVAEKEVHDAFIQAAENVDRAFQVYTEVNNAARSEELTYEKIRQANWRVNHTPSGLERTLKNSWTGPVRPILIEIAQKANYKVRFIGELPPVPHMVSIVANNDPIVDVLRDIAAKTDGLLDINIHDSKESKVIEVIYVDRFK